MSLAEGSVFFNLKKCPSTSDGSGSKIFDPSWVGSIFSGSGWVSHSWFGLEFGKFPLKTSNFSIFFPSGQKKLLRVGLLFTAGQK